MEEIIWCAPNQDSRDKLLNEIFLKTKKVLIHPYNNEQVIAGQATIALEFLENIKDLDVIVQHL